MTYTLGIDLGTTYTAASVAREGRAEVTALGYRATSVPTVVLLTEDGRFLVGDPAERRAAHEPNRVAREFKRRVGDPTPLLLGGTPVAVDRCLAEMLRWVTKTVAESEGGPPAGLTVTHPANWGEFKKDVLREALRLADQPESRLLPEPVAAATWYAHAERIPPGHVVAVYDLGGGTFDAAILRHTTDGQFETLGRAEGIERLGGIDVDEAVVGHVLRSLGEDGARLDRASEDPAMLAALAQLRRACVEAKEALSAETSVTIPVLLPGLHHEVLLHRQELEELVTPLLHPTIDALGRVVRSTGLRPDDVDSVLLVGGSSRIPLIARQVSAGFGRPVAVDAHPKHPVALGAALDAWSHLPAAAPAPAPMAAPPPLAVEPPPRPWSEGPTYGPPPRVPAFPPPGAQQADQRRALLIGGVATMVVLLLVLLFVALQPGDDDPPLTTASDNDGGQVDQPSSEGTGSTAPTTEAESDTGSGSGSGQRVDPTADPAPAFAAFAQIFDGNPVRASEIVLYPPTDDYDGWAIMSVQTPENPEFFDDYEWRGGIATRDDETLIPPTGDEIEQVLFDVTTVDSAIIPGLLPDALSRCPGEGMALSHIIINRFVPFDAEVRIHIYMSIPDRTMTGGYITYSLAGEFVENNCS